VELFFRRVYVVAWLNSSLAKAYLWFVVPLNSDSFNEIHAQTCSLES
jgi:hypothetical protein